MKRAYRLSAISVFLFFYFFALNYTTAYASLGVSKDNNCHKVHYDNPLPVSSFLLFFIQFNGENVFEEFNEAFSNAYYKHSLLFLNPEGNEEDSHIVFLKRLYYSKHKVIMFERTDIIFPFHHYS